MNQLLRRPGLQFALWSLFAIALLLPYFTTGYYQDDSLNSSLVGLLQLQHQTITQLIQQEITRWITTTGRFFPLSLITSYSVMYFVPDLTTYRWLHMAWVAADLLVFFALIHNLSGNFRIALLSVLITPTLFQLRDYHDPISSYAYLLQVAMFLGSSSLLLLTRFRKTSETWTLVGSLALYACALLLYETNLVFFPPLFYLAWTYRGTGNTLLARWGHAGVTGLYFLMTFALRALFPPQYNGVQITLGLKALKAFLFQLSAALPMSYAFFGRSGFYTFETLISREFLTWSAFGVFILASILSFALLRKPVNATNEHLPLSDPRGMKVLGWSLLLIPTAMIAISEKYQNQINLIGLGYLPVYLSYFGLAILVTPALIRTRHPLRVACIIGMIAAFTFSTNQIAADRLNRQWKFPRIISEKALQSGLVNSLPSGPSGALVLIYPQQVWINREFIQQHAGKDIEVQHLNAFINRPIPSNRPVYILLSRTKNEGDGVVIFSKISGLEWNEKNEMRSQLLPTDPTILVEFSNGRITRQRIADPNEVELKL